MAGSEYYDDKKCSYCGSWYDVYDNHTCKGLEEAALLHKQVEILQYKINTRITYSKAREFYLSGLREEDIIDVGFKLKSGWVSKYD